MSGENINGSSGFGMQNDQQQNVQGGVSIVTESQTPYYGSANHYAATTTNGGNPSSQLPVTSHFVVQRGSSGLPCSGIGLGWFLFILGFILGAIPWYAGACVFLCAKYDSREKAGLIACSVLAALSTVVVGILILLSIVWHNIG